jgi:alkylhydroperoxidase family enzyme
MSRSFQRVSQADAGNLDRAMTAMYGLEAYLVHSGLERSLIELVKIRASHLNGCAYCIDMHTKMPEPMVRASNGSTCLLPGRKARSTASANAPPCSGLTR